jgi:hypothetical protein
MRYQQVYSSALFSNLNGNIYLVWMEFSPNASQATAWAVPRMQVNLSTTAKSADGLSPVFSENVGPDDQVVFGPAPHTFDPHYPDGYGTVFFDRSFRYDTSLGNLLLDVRIFEGSSFVPPQVSLDAFDSPGDEVSRVWSTNVQASIADGADSTGLTTRLRFSPDSFITGPTPGTAETNTIFPFLIKLANYPLITNPLTMRYQQVYNATLFTNLDSDLIYITTLTFLLESDKNRGSFWTVTNMQVNLSTTSKRADTLSPVFSENVGSDDLVVFGPGNQYFSAGVPNGPLLMTLDRAFRYRPASGNLLLDVRIFNCNCPYDPFDENLFSDPALEAFSSSTDEVSKVWSTDVQATIAEGADSSGVTTRIECSPMPTLQSSFFPSYANGSSSNIIQIAWQPPSSVFVLQRTDRLGSNAVWQNVTNEILDSQRIIIQQSSAGSQGFYRLVWPGGQ